MHRLLYIARSLAIAAMLLLLLALAPAMAQNVTYQGETTTLAVDVIPGNNYQWELYNDGTGNLVTKPGNIQPDEAVFVGSATQASVQVNWLKPGVYYYKITVSDITGCSSNAKIGRMLVKEAKPTATILSGDQNICDGETATIEIALTGKSPWDLTYSDESGNVKTVTGITNSIYELKVNPGLSTQYFITEVKDQNATNTADSPQPVWVIVSPRPVFIQTIFVVEP